MKIETTKNNKTSIEVTEVEEFQGDMKTSLRTSLDVAETVSALFGSIFNDFYGCNVRVNNGNNVNTHPNVVHFVPAGMIYVDLYSDGSGTLERYKKKSFDWYKKVIESNGEIV